MVQFNAELVTAQTATHTWPAENITAPVCQACCYYMYINQGDHVLEKIVAIFEFQTGP